jgi:hypothetical protein
MPETRTFLRPDGRRFLIGRPDGELPLGELFAVVDERDSERLRSLEDLGFVRERRELLGFIGVRRSLRQRVARRLIGEAFSVLHARGELEAWTEVDETNVASRTLLERLPRGRSLVGAQTPLGDFVAAGAGSASGCACSSKPYLTTGRFAARTSSSRLTGR